MKFDDLIKFISDNACLDDSLVVDENLKSILNKVFDISKTICENKVFFRNFYNDNIRYCDYYSSTSSVKENLEYYKCYRDDNAGFLLYIYGQILLFLNQLLQEQELLSLIDNVFLNDLEVFINQFNSFIYDNIELFEMSNNELQCMQGKNIIVFFKSKGDSKFLVEHDLEQVLDIQSTDKYVKDILRVLDNNSYWTFKQTRLNHFCAPIREGRTQNSNAVSLYSDFSSKDCLFSRLKSPNNIGDRINDTRISCLKIDLCEENRQKLGVESNTVILILNLVVIGNINLHSNYSEFSKQLGKYYEEIQNVIKLFEDPTTPVEVLTEILTDSNYFYNRLTKNRSQGKKY